MVPRSPTARSLVGLAITLLAVTLFCWYALRQVAGLRDLQTRTIDLNRKDSLQLLRIQNNLHNLGLSMRDMTEGSSRYPLAAWQSEFDRTRTDLDDALRLERELAPTSRSPEQQAFLSESFEEFWEAAVRMFRLSLEGKEDEARSVIRSVLLPHQASLSTTTARFLVMNYEAEQQAAGEIEQIYSSVERNIYYFLIAVVLAISLTSAYLILQNRRVFRSMAQLSHQRQILARKLIDVQEDVFRSIARELHDEFGQVLTAVGAMLQRARKKRDEDPAGLTQSIDETRQVVQDALENVRQLSQRLHPNVLDDYGLEGAIEWYVDQVRNQSGLSIAYEKERGWAAVVPPDVAIHIYRILQESLNNVVRHSHAKNAWVRLGRHGMALRLEVEDRGVGLPEVRDRADGLGLVAMRERAELMQGRLTLSRPREGGTLVRLEVPVTLS